MTDHRYAPGVTKTKGIHARRDTPLQAEIQTGAGGEGETLPRKFFRSAFVVSIIFSSFLSFLSNFSFFYFYFYLYFLFSRSRPTIFFSRLSIFSTVRMSPLEVYFPASERIDKGCWYLFQYKYLVSLLCIETNARDVASHLRRPLQERACLRIEFLICTCIDDTVKLLLCRAPRSAAPFAKGQRHVTKVIRLRLDEPISFVLSH